MGTCLGVGFNIQGILVARENASITASHDMPTNEVTALKRLSAVIVP